MSEEQKAIQEGLVECQRHFDRVFVEVVAQFGSVQKMVEATLAEVPETHAWKAAQ